MADTINLPGLGKTKKSTAYIMGGAAALVVAVALFRSRTQGGAAAESGTGALGDAINPATGFPYGSDADLAALGQQSAIGGGGAGYAFPSGDGANYTGGGGSGSTFTTNAQWSQAAEDYLVNTVQGDANTVGNALGKYITGQPLSPDQVNIVTQAIAFTGYPPTNGPTGYPPSYRTATEPPTTTPPATGGGTTGPFGKITVKSVGKTVATLDWPAVKGADGYTVYKNGARVVSVKYSGVNLANMSPGRSYAIKIVPIPATGYKVGPSGSVTVHTKK